MAISGDYITCKGKTKRGHWCHRLRWRQYEGAKPQEKNFTGPTKQASRDAARDYCIKLRSGEFADSVSFETLVNRWREARVNTCKKSTLAEYDRFLRVYIHPFFGDRKNAASITPIDVQDFDQFMIAAGRSAGVRRQAHTILSAIFNYGVKKHLLTLNPTTAMDKPPAKKRDVYVLTTQQRQALIAACANPKYKMLFALAMFTGLRQGELLGLRWTSIDFARGVILVREQYSNGDSSAPKGGKSRDVPFDDRTSDWLCRWRANSGGDGLVFSDSNGNHIDAKNMCNREWRPTLIRSGIRDQIALSGRSPFRFHDLRHVYASVLLSKGASLHDVQRALGHASQKTTEDNYAHLETGYFDSLRENVGELTSGIDMDAKSPIRAVN